MRIFFIFSSITVFFTILSTICFAQCISVFDETPPAIPIMDSVSINPTNGNIVLAWTPSTSLDTKGYVIYQLNNGVWLNIATVNGINTTSFTYVSGAVSSSIDFRIAAFDSCANISPQGTIHKTIFVKVEQDKCAKINKLYWNAYQGWAGISSYAVYASKNGSPQQLLALTSGSTTSYLHNKIDPLTTYCYYVRAVDNTQTKSALSHQLCLVSEVYKVPEFLYLVSASVENELVKLRIHADKTADLNYYLVQRATNSNSNYKTIDTLKPSISSNELIYTDFTAEVNNAFYYYKVLAVDSCSINVKESENTVNSILLTGIAQYDLNNNLRWNFFETWNAGTKTYQLFRGEENSINTLLAFSDTTLYLDNIKSFIIPSGNYCYQVEALEGDVNNYGYKATSKSNVLCLQQEPSIFVPNAFNPSGEFNKCFLPKGMFFDNENYSLLIFNRIGEKIFESNDPLIGWDGKDTPIGIYVYKITYSKNNNLTVVNGTVTLIR